MKESVNSNTGHLKFPNQRKEKKKKNEKDWNAPRGLIRHQQADHYKYYGKPEEEKGAESLFKEMVAQNFPNQGEEMVSGFRKPKKLQIWEI